MITEYLEKRSSLMCLFVLIDIRHSAQKIDQDFMKWLAVEKVPFVIAFTKSDKISKSKIIDNIDIYKNYMLQNWENLPETFITSAEKKIGQQNILDFIKKLNPKFKKSI